MKYQSDKTDIVCQAIEDARQEFLPLEKSGVNNFFKNRKGEPHLYSTLDNIFDACMPALHKYKLSVVYQARILETNTGIENILTTTITHIASNQFILSATTLGNQTAKSQDVGSAITYLRRYQIQAMLNLEADFEDDGNSASGNKTDESNIIEIKEKKNMPSRKYISFDSSGKPSSNYSNFTSYMANLNPHNMKQHHEWCSVTIIQLQDIMGWAEDLPKEHSRSAKSMIGKCETQIKFIKGE
jgi:metal-sulfur cluster biosynthetic enzyme